MNSIFIKIATFAAACALGSACATSGTQQAGIRTDALDGSAWESSSWISVVDAPVVTGKVRDSVRAADGANWFLSSIVIDKKVASAKWMVTSLGIFEIYVNGQPVGTEILRPGFTHPLKTRISYTYDITGLLNTKAGASNVFSAQVTPGWWADKIVTSSGSEGMQGSKCAFRGVVELTFTDGTKALYGTDTENWKAGIAGPVKHAAIFDGEIYDARIAPGFETPDAFSTPEVNTEFTGEIVPSVGAEIYLRKDLTLSPVKAYTWEGVEGAADGEHGKVVITKEFAAGEPMTVKPGETLVVDFGQNASAVPSFVFKAAEGTVLTCKVAELLNDGNGAESRGMDGPEGSIHRRNLRIPETGMYLQYTFAGSDKPEEYRPHCTFFGYRYISVTATDEVLIRSISSVPVTSIRKDLETGTLKTGNDLINKLISNTIWGQRSNYLSVPTDCPQRNERLGWTADTQVFSETGTFFANTDGFFHKWLRDIRDTQGPLGGYPGVAPMGQYGCADDEMMRLGWSDAGIIVPWTIWKQFGDATIIDESWESMERFMNRVNETKYDHKANVSENRNYQWADWLSYEPLESNSGRAFGVNGPLPDAVAYWNYLLASYWMIDAGMMRDMAAASGRDAGKYERMVADAKAYIKENFLTPEGLFKTDILNTMQTPALFALKNGVVEGESGDRMIARLRKNFAEHGNCLQTGFLGTSILMSTLTDNGMVDIAYELLFQRKNPSWLYSVDNGATTIWERWNSYTIEDGMGPAGMNSFNHYAYGSVCEWIWETAAGISADVANPGFRHIIMKPVPDKRLGSIEAAYNSASGLIKSSWKYEGEKCIWTFTIPDGATATVTLPGSDESKDYSAGTYTIEM